MKTLRIGSFAIAFCWYLTSAGWRIQKGNYGHGLSDWRHGTAWLAKLKVMW